MSDTMYYDRDGRPAVGLPPVETEVWEPDAERPGYLRKVRTRTVDEVFLEVRERLFAKSEHGNWYFNDDCDESFGIYPLVERGAEWPEGRIVVFPVTGGSEGHYVHVEVIYGGKAELMFLGKTFAGWDAAWRFAKALGEVLAV